ncbi:hypothetical protein, partial [Kocuria salsicia]|uniref:hypothetical protein n=1 Tax=Kocuria salsicia TaxID=664639 RepID=UPI001C93183B
MRVGSEGSSWKYWWWDGRGRRVVGVWDMRRVVGIVWKGRVRLVGVVVIWLMVEEGGSLEWVGVEVRGEGVVVVGWGVGVGG